MKILAFSDLHRDTDAARKILEQSADADVVVGCGDFSTKRVGAGETLDILSDIEVPVAFVHGNHDNPDEIATYCDRVKNLHYLHGNSVVIGNTTFAGLGGEIPSRNSFDWNSAETEVRAAELLADMPPGAVLVTHTPPHGVADLQKTGVHEGSEAIRNAILRTKPKLALCGHIHHAWGMEGHIASTFVKNLGPGVNWFEI